MLTQKQTLLVASALGFLAVALGAFGAHALKEMLSASGRLETYELAVRYHFYHALALLAAGILMGRNSDSSLGLSATFLLIGIVLFSGSLYALCLLNISRIAIITPIGGVFLLAGWTTLFVSVFRSSKP
jgi:uncharacterized membrane protein YgdD (TMEM256/DUF423 family)